MPWTASQAHAKTHKASTKAKRKKWVRVANSILRQSGDEGKAIRIANSMMKKHRKS